MTKLMRILFLIVLISVPFSLKAAEPTLIYWNSDAGKILRSRISPDADYWQLSPWFAEQINQTYCSVASAITVLNAMPIKKPVDPVYAPNHYFTQSNYFTPEVIKIITPQTVLAQGMTREEMTNTLIRQGVKAISLSGDALDDKALRAILRKALGDDGQFVLANYLRSAVGQEGGGHWSALAAYDAQTDRVLILDVAKYMYAPAWVEVGTLQKAIATIDSTSNKPRGLVFVSEPQKDDLTNLQAYYQQVAANPIRTDEDRQVDAARKPVEFLQFAQVRPGMLVLDVSTGRGYTTQLLALAVGNSGKVWAQAEKLRAEFNKRLEEHPQPNILPVALPFEDPAPSDIPKLDLITIVLNYHDIAYMPVDRSKMDQHLFNALKPGGHLVVIDHSAKPGEGITVAKKLHRIEESVVLEEFKQAGFKLEQAGDFLHNPLDPREQAFFNMKMPTDSFALRFVKPE